MLCSCVFPDPSNGRGIVSATTVTAHVSGGFAKLVRCEKRLGRVTQVWQNFSSVLVATPHLLGPVAARSSLLGLRFRCSRNCRLGVWTRAKSSSGVENEGDDDGSKDMQELLVDLLRLETGKVRVNEFVEDRSKFLTEIAEQAGEEFDRIAEEAKKTMDAAGSKVLEQIDAEAAGFEEELAAARAEMEASERDLDEFEKNVEQARSQGLFFKSLFTTPTKPWKSKSPEEQMEIKDKAKVVTEKLYQENKKVAASKFRRIAYGVMIILLTLAVLETVSSDSVEWTRLMVYILILVALVVQLTYETMVSRRK